MKENYDQVLEVARRAFASGKTRSLSWRLSQLKNVQKLLEENEAEILAALKKDMRKHSFEAKLGESENAKNELNHLIKNLRKYAADEKLPWNALACLDRGYVRKEPFGVVLVLSPWNYPFSLSLQPVCGAIAAGNVVILKPSEVSSESAKTMARLFPKYVDPDCCQVVLGGAEETKTLLLQRFDYIFYTGSSTVGKKIAAAAAVHLTPTTLELGGKSPCYVDENADFKLAAKRILWGKCMNLGQTCVAPDYLLCSKQAEEEFIRVAHEVFSEWFTNKIQECEDLPRIINQTHFNRIKKLLESSKGKIAYGGASDSEDLWIHPTIVVDVDGDDALLQPENEIFGPILPIVNVNSVDEAIEFINARPKPLALYCFSNSPETSKKLINSTSSGGVCCNDVIWHLLWPLLPFGGVGASGYGSYHGRYSFETFSHKRAVLIRGFSYLSEKLGEARYPPYSEYKLSFFKFIIRFFEPCNFTFNLQLEHFFAAFVGAFLLFIVLYLCNLLLI